MKKLIVAAAGLGLAAAGLIGMAAPANAVVDPATYGDNCYWGKGGAVESCVTVTPVKGKAMKTKYNIKGYFSPTILADPAMAGQKVCLYRIAQPGTNMPESEVAACWKPAADGTYAFWAQLGFVGNYHYNVGPKKLKWGVGNPAFSPDFQLKTTK